MKAYISHFYYYKNVLIEKYPTLAERRAFLCPVKTTNKDQNEHPLPLP